MAGVVRRDDEGHPAGDPGENPASRCGDPAGASPVSVSGNAPSSRLLARGETPEVGFRDCSYGFRPGRSTTQALVKIRVTVNRGFNQVLDGDIRDFFGQIDHSVCLSLVARKISDRRVLKLVRQWLEARVMEDGLETTKLSGAPQGGVISPLLSNIYLGFLDEGHAVTRIPAT